MMGIISTIFSEVDMLNYADTYVNNPIVTRDQPLPFLMYSGTQDTYTPIQTQNALIQSANLPILDVPGSSIGGSQSTELAAGVVQYNDGHFVLLNDSDAQQTLKHFLTTAKDGSDLAEIVRYPVAGP